MYVTPESDVDSSRKVYYGNSRNAGENLTELRTAERM